MKAEPLMQTLVIASIVKHMDVKVKKILGTLKRVGNSLTFGDRGGWAVSNGSKYADVIFKGCLQILYL